jgi:hypothetical protein
MRPSWQPTDSRNRRGFARRPEIAWGAAEPRSARTIAGGFGNPPRVPTTIALFVFGAFLSYACGGCLSNEYVIPRTELARLTQLPPEQRGQQVQVVQGLGSRRGDAIDTTQPQPAYDQGQGYAPQPEGYAEGGPGVGVGVFVAPFPPPLLVPPLPGPGFVGGGHGARAPGAMGRGMPAPRRPAATGGGGNLGGGKLGSGGGGKDDLVALLVVVAVLATVGMIATEGARFDGNVAMYPWQPVHLKDGNGQVREIPLAEITAADVATTSEATIADDEGWGIMRLGRRPLDRKGFAFKMELGFFESASSALDAGGLGMNLQLGFFPHHMVGLLGSWSIAGGSDAQSNSFSRNNLAFEAQFFPLGVWRMHLGGFGHVGNQWAHDADLGTRDGLALGGGAILEIALTTRLALSFRADYTTAKVGPDGDPWQAAMMFTGGVAIY